MPQVFSNRTIDDQSGDSVSGVLPSYSPPQFWNQGSGCSGCTLHPDAALAFNRTWHDSSQPAGAPPVSVSLDFVGTAIWVFCIAPPVMQNETITHYQLSFDLDNGAHRGNFTHSPTGNEYLYNISVVSLPSLSNMAHTLLISTDGSVDGSAFLFDYAVYTAAEGEEDARTQTSTGTSPGTVAGIVFGALLLILLVLALLRLRVLRKRERNRMLPPILPVVEPFVISPKVVSESKPPVLSSSPVSSTSPVSESRTVVLGSEAVSTNTPSELMRVLRLALDTAVSMQQTAVGSTQGAESGIMIPSPGSEDRTAVTSTRAPTIDIPPPVYQPRASMSKT